MALLKFRRAVSVGRRSRDTKSILSSFPTAIPVTSFVQTGSCRGEVLREVGRTGENVGHMTYGLQGSVAPELLVSHWIDGNGQARPPLTLKELGERRSEEHTSELQSLMRISYAVFCLQKKNANKSKLVILYNK